MRIVNAKHDIQTLHSGAWGSIIVAMAAAAVTSSCFFGTATNLCEKSGRRCSPGQTCAANQDICVDISGCGDGVVSPKEGEVCDDGNVLNGDGCSADCKSDETCGNNIIDAVETCDDGNTNTGDGCSASCLKERCGDGIYNSDNEACDTGVDTQACNGHGLCTIPRCGDGYTNPEFTPFRAPLEEKEQCDEGDPKTGTAFDSPICNGNNNGLDGPGSCRFPACGDSYTNEMFKPDPDGMNTEACDTGGNSLDCNGHDDVALRDDDSVLQANDKDSQCQIPRCGDKYVNPMFKPNPNGPNVEKCDTGGDSPECNGHDDVALRDDGSVLQANNRDSQCQVSRCGDNYVNPMFKPNPNGSNVEKCDTGGDSPECNGASDGDPDHPNSIDARCQVPQCGDGYFNSNTIVLEKSPEKSHEEQCDDGKNTSDCNGNDDNPSGIGNCMKPRCGDGYINPAFVPDPTFSWPRNTLGEECDNGPQNNDTDPNACRTDCRKAFCGDGVLDTDEKCDKGDPVKKIKKIDCAIGICQDNCKCV